MDQLVSQPPWVPFPHLHINDTLDANLAVFDNSNMAPEMRGVLHRHDFHELMWLEEGEALFFSDFHQYELSAGTLIFISPGQLHAWRGDWEAFRLQVMMFRINALNAWTRDLMKLLPYDKSLAQPFIMLPADRQAIIDFQFATALTHFRESGTPNPDLLFAYLNVLLSEAAQHCQAVEPVAAANSTEALAAKFQQAVDTNFQNRLTVTSYADMLGVTLNHLVQTIRETTGQTPKQMIQQRLLLEAKRLLVHTAEPVHAISAELAFQDASQFSRWFKKGMGLSPNQFRSKFELP